MYVVDTYSSTKYIATKGLEGGYQIVAKMRGIPQPSLRRDPCDISISEKPCPHDLVKHL